MKQKMKSMVIEQESLVEVVEDLFAKAFNSFSVGWHNSMQKRVKLGF